MELKVQNYDLPSAIQFNYDELKNALTEKCHEYEVMVYTDDQIKIAKSDRANLNKLKKALNDERLRREREYMAPFTEFKDKINEIISIIDKPASLIDARVKEFEQKKKDEKKEQIAQLFAEFNFPDYITLEKVWNDAWLSSSCSLSRVKEDFKTIAFRDEKAVVMLKALPEYSFEALEYYKKCIDVTQAIEKATEYSRMEKAKKAAAEKKVADTQVGEEIPMSDPEPEKVEENTEEEHFWVSFKAYLTAKEATELRAFFDYNKIKFEAIMDKEGN